jgi:hypothetical protein
LDAHPEISLVYGRAVPFRSGNLPLVTTPSEGDEHWESISGVSWVESICRDGCNPIYSPEAIVRTRLQKDLGGYRAQLPHTADLEMWLRFACRGDVARIDVPQALYRLHGQNMSEAYCERLNSVQTTLGAKDFVERKAAFDLLFHEMRPWLPGVDRLERVANEGLSWNAFWGAHKQFEKGNDCECEKLLGLARTYRPEIVASRAWSRMMWKRRIGTRAWSRLGGLLRAVRSLGRHSQPPQTALS